MADDPNWPRASAWLSGQTGRELVVAGVPLRLGSITPGRCDLAPQAMRSALERFSTWDFDAGVDVRQLRVTHLGNLPVAELRPEDAFQIVVGALQEFEAAVLLGGDNSVTRLGVHALGLTLDRCALLTVDAHLDLRSLDGGLSNGNPVRALLADGLPGDHIVQIGIQSFANSPDYAAVARDAGIRVISADQVRERTIDVVIGEALDSLAARASAVYVDLDLDVLDRVYAPGTPGSRPGGLTPAQIRRAAHRCGMHPKVRILDIVELDPTKDIADVTALSGAACLLSFASGLVRRFQGE